MTKSPKNENILKILENLHYWAEKQGIIKSFLLISSFICVILRRNSEPALNVIEGTASAIICG